LRLHGLAPDEADVKVIETELTDTGSLTHALKGADVVFNCAGTIMTGELTEQQLIENNINITRSVVDAALAAGVPKIIHTSSIVVLDKPEGTAGPEGIAGPEDAVRKQPKNSCNTPLTENDRVEITSSDSAYAQSKYGSDMEIARGAAQGLETVTVMPAVVIGEGDWSLNGSSAIVGAITRGLPVYTDGVMAYVDVRDTARAMLSLDLSPQAVGHEFILAGSNLSFRELFTLGAVAAGKRKPFIKTGKGLLLTGYGIIKALVAMRLMKNRGLKRQNLDSMLYGNRYDGTKIEKFCGFAYTPIDITIDRVVKNYMAEKGR
jgi:nucleoside-diphosphate-sugar epimerase